LVFDDTLVVFTVKVALVLPAATVTLEGTVATEVFPLVSVTTAPPEGAFPLSVTVPVELFPPLTLVGFRVSEERVTAAAGVTVSVADWFAPPYVPEIETLVFCDTLVVLTLKVALVLPAATVTLEGTVATDVFPLVSVTTVPPEGAVPLRVTVPVESLPPVTLVGFRVSEERVTAPPGVTVKLADSIAPPYVPEMATLVLVDTLSVLTVKVALVARAGTVTLDGMFATNVFPLPRGTTAPPEGAFALRVTVPVELFPPLTLVGFKVSEEMAAPGVTVKLVDTVAVPDCAKTGKVKLLESFVVPKVKVALVFPAATVTMMGRSTGGLGSAALLCETDTKTALPPDGAAAVRVTVPVELLPPGTLVGFRLIEETFTPGVSVREACTVLLPRDAVMVTAVLLRTNPLVVTAKVALLAPAGTVTLPGTMMKELFELSPTTEPPDGAAPLKVTVPVDVPPFGMVVGFNVSDERVGPHPPPVLGVSSKMAP
jgi:hypothetical protein